MEPLLGRREETAGEGIVNVFPVPLPTDVVTFTGPVVAPLGTVQTIFVLDQEETKADTPLNVTVDEPCSWPKILACYGDLITDGAFIGPKRGDGGRRGGIQEDRHFNSAVPGGLGNGADYEHSACIHAASTTVYGDIIEEAVGRYDKRFLERLFFSVVVDKRPRCQARSRQL